ncbi:MULTISPECIES: hypothetical protein [Bacteroides]|nr:MULTISPECIES: hypothetical protein [Bacteroides]
MPCCFGVPKLRLETARAGRRLSALASPVSCNAERAAAQTFR